MTDAGRNIAENMYESQQLQTREAGWNPTAFILMKMFWQRFNQEIIILITEPFLPEIRREALITEAEDGSRMGSAGGTETQMAAIRPDAGR